MVKEHTGSGSPIRDSNAYGAGTRAPAIGFARRHAIVIGATIILLAVGTFWLIGRAFVFAPTFTVEDAWARPAGAGDNSAAYMQIKNNLDESVALVGASSEIAMMVEIHQTSMDQSGVMRMKQVTSVEIPAGAELELKPQGLHVMLMGLNHDLEAGDIFSVTLEFDGADPHRIDVPVGELDH